MFVRGRVIFTSSSKQVMRTNCLLGVGCLFCFGMCVCVGNNLGVKLELFKKVII